MSGLIESDCRSHLVECVAKWDRNRKHIITTPTHTHSHNHHHYHHYQDESGKQKELLALQIKCSTAFRHSLHFDFACHPFKYNQISSGWVPGVEVPHPQISDLVCVTEMIIIKVLFFYKEDEALWRLTDWWRNSQELVAFRRFPQIGS